MKDTTTIPLTEAPTREPDDLRLLTQEVDELRDELAHARMGLELKDAFAMEMRSLADEREVEAHEARLHVQELQRAVVSLNAQLMEARALLATRTGELAVARVEAAEKGAELHAVTNRASYLLIAGLTKGLDRFRPLARIARRLARYLSPAKS